MPRVRNLTAVFCSVDTRDVPMLKQAAMDAGMSLSAFVHVALNDALEDSGLALTEVNNRRPYKGVRKAVEPRLPVWKDGR